MQHRTGNSVSKSGKRSERYTQKELRFLLEEVRKYPNIIESPNSHSETKHRKFVLWQHISKELQTKFPDSSCKSPVQLRNWWKRTKSRAKQRLSCGSFSMEKCKFTENGIREVHENSRGYLETIFSEICEFRRQIMTSYTPEKENSEFTKFLEETSEDYNPEDGERVGGPSESSEFENDSSTDSFGAFECGKVVSFSCNRSINFEGNNHVRSSSPRDAHKETNISPQHFFDYDPTETIVKKYNEGESILQKDNTSGLLSQIFTNAAANFLANYKHLIENPSLCNMSGIYYSDTDMPCKTSNENSGDGLTEDSSLRGNSSSFFIEASKNFELSTNENNVFCIPSFSNHSNCMPMLNASKSFRNIN
ncbi:unnamed protein product, partial [Schistosoma margrebowiei]|uniref:Myb/SANT-like DNA-binding domain-containing protein n=1 Tax=Schistosoma margrebowiei TaxID=48269 RepID=A0AA84Z8K8_9TREM